MTGRTATTGAAGAGPDIAPIGMLSGMAKPTAPDDPAEPDLYWAGHSGFAMLPGAVVGAALSAVVMLAAPSVGEFVDLARDTTAFVRFWLILLGWVAAGLVWAYRGASYVYRLTPRFLFVEYGMLHRPVAPIPLKDITAVEERAWTLRRLFGVGAVVVRSGGRPPVRLSGVFRPERLAQAIRKAVKEVKGE
jgi:membrane protein YdbS with pleckstrin-like domain